MAFRSRPPSTGTTVNTTQTSANSTTPTSSAPSTSHRNDTGYARWARILERISAAYGPGSRLESVRTSSAPTCSATLHLQLPLPRRQQQVAGDADQQDPAELHG